MVEVFSFARLPVIHFGAGSFLKVHSLIKGSGKRVLLVTGERSFRRSKWWSQLITGLDDSKIEYEVASFSGEPTTAAVDSIAAKFRSNPPDVVVAAGGGSVLDAGKAISAMIPVTGSAWDYLEGNPDMKPHPGSRLPYIAVPTTAGTGSEATKNAVLSTTGETGLKRSLRHDNFVPDIALVDPQLALECPPDVTAAGGLDAITQLLEAFVSRQASAMTDALAFSGLERGLAGIRRVFEDGSDIEGRTGMAYAALISGIVLANAGLGAVHGFASVLGGYYQIPHGVICGTLLGAVTRANISKLSASDPGSEYLRKYAAAGRLISARDGMNDDYYLRSLTDSIDKLIDDLALPRLGKFGVKPGDIHSLAGETGIKNNPANLERQELEQILLSRL